MSTPASLGSSQMARQPVSPQILSQIERVCGEHPDYRDRLSAPSTADSRDSGEEAIQGAIGVAKGAVELVGDILGV